LQASLVGGQGWSPVIAFDPAGNLFLAEPGLNVIRQITNTAFALHVSPDHIDFAGSGRQSQTITVSGNFAEPFPYAVRVSTADSNSWLSANRATGLTGESIRVTVNPASLAPGTYHGTISVTVPTGISQEVDVPVTLTRP
jgi:hypothetical protein